MELKIGSEHTLQKDLKDVKIACSRDDEEFECLPCFSEDKVFDSRDLKDAEFIFMYLALFKDLGVRLPFTDFERWFN